jgi:hypothetical protein
MKKPYTYKDNTLIISEGELVRMEIVFPDPATEAHTFINLPGDNDFEFVGDGSFEIGPFKSELAGICVITATPVNIKQDVYDVRYTLRANGDDLVIHSNPKSENELPQLIILIKLEMA